MAPARWRSGWSRRRRAAPACSAVPPVQSRACSRSLRGGDRAVRGPVQGPGVHPHSQNGGTSIELLAAYNGGGSVARARVPRSALAHGVIPTSRSAALSEQTVRGSSRETSTPRRAPSATTPPRDDASFAGAPPAQSRRPSRLSRGGPGRSADARSSARSSEFFPAMGTVARRAAGGGANFEFEFGDSTDRPRVQLQRVNTGRRCPVQNPRRQGGVRRHRPIRFACRATRDRLASRVPVPSAASGAREAHGATAASTSGRGRPGGGEQRAVGVPQARRRRAAECQYQRWARLASAAISLDEIGPTSSQGSPRIATSCRRPCTRARARRCSAGGRRGRRAVPGEGALAAAGHAADGGGAVQEMASPRRRRLGARDVQRAFRTRRRRWST